MSNEGTPTTHRRVVSNEERPGRIYDSPERAEHAASSPDDRSADRSRDAHPLMPVAEHESRLRSWLAMITLGIVDAVTFVAFIAAISLPFLYLPLLLFGGIDAARSTAFFLLLGLHVASLTIGYRYESQTPFGGD